MRGNAPPFTENQRNKSFAQCQQQRATLTIQHHPRSLHQRQRRQIRRTDSTCECLFSSQTLPRIEARGVATCRSGIWRCQLGMSIGNKHTSSVTDIHVFTQGVRAHCQTATKAGLHFPFFVLCRRSHRLPGPHVRSRRQGCAPTFHT